MRQFPFRISNGGAGRKAFGNRAAFGARVHPRRIISEVHIMKVLLVNGSPRAHGCTYTALCEVAKALEEEGVESAIFQVGTRPVQD